MELNRRIVPALVCCDNNSNESGSILMNRAPYALISSDISHIYLFPFHTNKYALRILATLEAKTAKISNFWTFWPVIQLIHLLLTSRCTPFCPTVHRCKKCSDIRIFETWSINRITVQNVQKLLILAVLASSVASILKACKKRSQ